MTLLGAGATAASDAELITRVRGGDLHAYGELFDRHRDAAYRIARQLSRGPDADDLVSEAFTKVLAVLKSGGGPDVAFRAYLLTAIRRLHVDRLRAAGRVQPTDDLAPWDRGVPFQDPAVDDFERSAAARAFASLPERWQLALWHLEVEGQKPAEVGVLLGLSANSVSALAYRAREGLRQAYLRMHLADTAGEACRWTTEHLSAHVRGALSRRDAARVEEHLRHCRRCNGLCGELVDVNDNLRGVLAPLVLGGLAAAYLDAGLVGAGGTIAPILGKLGSFLAAPAHALAAGGIAATTAAAVVIVTTPMGGGGSSGTQSLAGPPEGQLGLPTGATRSATARPTGAATDQVPANQRRTDDPPGPSISQGAEAAVTTTALASAPPTTPTAPSSSTDSPTSIAPTTAPTLAPTAAPPTSAAPTTPSPPVTATPLVVPTLPTVQVSTVVPSTVAPSLPTGTDVTVEPTLHETSPPEPASTSDLAVSLALDGAGAGQVGLTATVTQTRPPAHDVTLRIDLPIGSTPTRQSPRWNCEPIDRLGDLLCAAIGAPAPLTLQVTYDQTATVTAVVEAPDNADPNPENNTAAVTIN